MTTGVVSGEETGWLLLTTVAEMMTLFTRHSEGQTGPASPYQELEWEERERERVRENERERKREKARVGA